MLPLPTENAPAGLLHGWYSKKQSAEVGISYYRSPSGGEVEVTEVMTSSRPCTWDDRKYVGLVCDNWLRKGLLGSIPLEKFHD